MKKIMIGFLFAALAACSNKKEVIENTADRPSVSFSKDTVMVREKDWTNILSTGNGKLTLYCSEPGHELNMQMEDTSSRIHILYRGVELVSGASVPVMDSVQLFCVADEPGLYSVDLFLTDRLGRGDSKKLFIRCLAATDPVPNFFWRDLGSEQLQTWNYLFDASGSVKNDGVITAYHYSINGQKVETNKPVMNWTFHAKGSHVIGLSVTDDLGRTSPFTYQTLTIL
ncbi:MAG: hypothetical protein V4539_16250 [Bacteroidota bacterium]